MTTKPTETIEDYLGIIYTLQRDGEEVIGARLAEILDVSAPTVTVTLKRMLRDGWVNIDDKKHVSLTKKGVDAAKSVIRRHMLTEWLLSRVLHIPLSELHDEAHKIEHTISSQVEEQLIVSLDDPDLCPHGNPFPGQEIVSEGWLPLTQFENGDWVTIHRIHEFLEDDHEIITALVKEKIYPGVNVQINNFNSEKNILYITINGKQKTLSSEIAQKIFAKIQNNES